MNRRRQTSGARRAARLILTICRVPNHLADISSVAEIIDTETSAPDYQRLSSMHQQLLAAFVNLLSFAESRATCVDDYGNLVTDAHVDEARAALAAIRGAV